MYSDEVIYELEKQFANNEIEGITVYTNDGFDIELRGGFKAIINPQSSDIEMIWGRGYTGGEQYLIPYINITKIQVMHLGQTKSLY